MGHLKDYMETTREELINLVEQWASSFGYYDNRIDLTSNDLSGFTTPDCSLIAHAPLWSTKPGQETPMPAAKVRENLAKYLRWTRISRHEMHIARHPDANSLCLFFVVKIRLFFFPLTLMTVPLAFVVTAERTETGLRINRIDEWSAETPAAASALLAEKCGWPSSVPFEPIVAFGATS